MPAIEEHNSSTEIEDNPENRSQTHDSLIANLSVTNFS